MKKFLPPVASLPYIEELLSQTKTTRDDWLFGAAAIAAALHVAPYYIYNGMDGVEDITSRIRSDGSASDTVWVALKTDIAKYLAGRLVLGPAAPPPPPPPSQNGHTPDRIGLTPDTLKDIHDLRVDVQGLRADMTSLRQSVNELARVVDQNTVASRELKERL